MAKKNLPAPLFPIFIDFFEKQVTKVQQQIEDLRKLEPLYNVARSALESTKTRDARLDTGDSGVRITIDLGERGHYKHHEALIERITEGLNFLGLRDSRPPSRSKETWSVYYFWHCIKKDKRLTISLKLMVPFEGNTYCKILKTERMTTSYDYEAIWLDENLQPEEEPKEAPEEAF